MDIITNADNIVVYAAPEITLSNEGMALRKDLSSPRKTIDRNLTTANAAIYKVDHLPKWYLGGHFSYTPEDGFQVIPDREAQLVEHHRPALLERLNRAAKTREEAGITLSDGTPVRTDRKTQQRLAEAMALVSANPDITIDWKMGTGEFVQLDAATIKAMFTAVAAHVQSVFTWERAQTELINAATTLAELNALEW